MNITSRGTTQNGKQKDAEENDGGNKFLYKDLSYKLLGLIFEIRKKYGPGHKEKVYQNLLAELLTHNQINYQKEKRINIYSEFGTIAGTYIPDFIIDDKIILELKSSKFTIQQDEKQFYHYIRNSKYEAAYLINFSTPILYWKRIVYGNYRKPFLQPEKHTAQFSAKNNSA